LAVDEIIAIIINTYFLGQCMENLQRQDGRPLHI